MQIRVHVSPRAWLVILGPAFLPLLSSCAYTHKTTHPQLVTAQEIDRAREVIAVTRSGEEVVLLYPSLERGMLRGEADSGEVSIPLEEIAYLRLQKTDTPWSVTLVLWVIALWPVWLLMIAGLVSIFG